MRGRCAQPDRVECHVAKIGQVANGALRREQQGIRIPISLPASRTAELRHGAPPQGVAPSARLASRTVMQELLGRTGREDATSCRFRAETQTREEEANAYFTAPLCGFAFLATRLFASPAPAAADDEQKSLDELVGGETYTVGDKLFYDWEVVENRSTASADPLQILVGAIGDDPSLVKLRFDGGMNQALYAEGNDLIVFTFRFKVKALYPKQRSRTSGLLLRYVQLNDLTNITEFVDDLDGSLLELFASCWLIRCIRKSRRRSIGEVIVVEKYILMGGGMNFETFEPEVSS